MTWAVLPSNWRKGWSRRANEFEQRLLILAITRLYEMLCVFIQLEPRIIFRLAANALRCDVIQIVGKSEVRILIVRSRCARPYGELGVTHSPD